MHRRLLLGLCSLFLLLSLSLHAETFTNPFRIPLPETPDTAGSADFNGDGLPDFYYIKYSPTPILHVLLAQANGTYVETSAFAINHGICSTADLNQDHKDDIICAHYDAVTSATVSVSVYLGHGDGTFGSSIDAPIPVNQATYMEVISLAFGDVNNDGHPDVVLFDNQSAQVFAFLGDGSGRLTTSYVPNIPNSVYLSTIPSITLADVNGDGYLDAVASDGPTVFLGNGDGSFTLVKQDSIGFNCVFADFDGDHHLDSLCAYNGTPGPGLERIIILHGEPDGSFNRTPVYQQDVFVSDFGIPLAARDLNGDGLPDLIALSADSLSVFLTQPGPSLSAPQPYVFYDVFANTLSNSVEMPALIADYNHDGFPDLATPGVDGIYILYGRNGGFNPAPIVRAGPGPVSASLAVADFNEDGFPDAVTGGNYLPYLALGVGDGTFHTATPVPASGLPDHSATYIAFPAGDFNGDGHQDFIAASVYGPTEADLLYPGHGDGTFSNPIAMSYPTTYGSITDLYRPVVVDLNHDGRADIIGVQGNDAPTDSILAYLSAGDGSFTLHSSGSFPVFSGPDSPYHSVLSIADFNQDGNLDVMFSNSEQNVLLLGHSDGTFTQDTAHPPPTPCSSSPFDVPAATAGDFDNDGHADFAILCNTDNSLGTMPATQLLVYYGNGNGSFTSPVIATLNNTYRQLSSADFNGDHLQDFLLTSTLDYVTDRPAIATIHTLPGRTLGPQQNFIAGSGLFPSGIADFNQDGRPDLYFDNGSSGISDNSGGPDPYGPDDFVVLMNLGDSPFVRGLLTASPEPSQAHQTFTLTAALTPSGGETLSGSVTFSIDGSPAGSAPLTSNSAILTIAAPTLAVGIHSLSTTWPGDSTYPATTINGTHTVVALPTTTSLTSSANPELAGNSIAFTATLSDPTATGAITFYDGANSLSTVNAAAGIAAYTTSTLTAGTHTITALYSGDTQFAASTSASLSQVVNLIPTTTQLTAAPNPAVAGQTITLTASVSNAATATLTPTGSVIFYDGGTSLGSANLSGSGQASFNAILIDATGHSLTAQYTGNSAHAASTSSAFGEDVSPLAIGARVSSSLNPSTYGQSVTFTDTLTALGPGSAIVLAPGSITFRVDGVDLGTVNVTVATASTASAQITSSTLTPGLHSISAVYSGNSSAGSILAVLQQVVLIAPTATTLSATPNPAYQHQTVTLSATASSGGTPLTGSVRFFDGSTLLGASAPNAAGQATLGISTLNPGTHSITAAYTGDANTAASTSTAVSLVINPSDFTLALNPSSLSLVTGHHATITLTATSVGNFADTLSLSVPNLPVFGTATFTPPAISLAAGGQASSLLYIDTSDVLGYYSRSTRPGSRAPLLALLLAPLTLALARRRARRLSLLAVLLAAALFASLTGCTGQLPNTTPPGGYILHLTATGASSGLTHTIDLPLTVTPQ